MCTTAEMRLTLDELDPDVFGLKLAAIGIKETEGELANVADEKKSELVEQNPEETAVTSAEYGFAAVGNSLRDKMTLLLTESLHVRERVHYYYSTIELCLVEMYYKRACASALENIGRSLSADGLNVPALSSRCKALQSEFSNAFVLLRGSASRLPGVTDSDCRRWLEATVACVRSATIFVKHPAARANLSQSSVFMNVASGGKHLSDLLRYFVDRLKRYEDLRERVQHCHLLHESTDDHLTSPLDWAARFAVALPSDASSEVHSTYIEEYAKARRRGLTAGGKGVAQADYESAPEVTKDEPLAELKARLAALHVEMADLVASGM